MHPIVYLPKVNTPNSDHLRAVGLEDFVDGAQFNCLQPDKPAPGDNKGGSLVTWTPPGRRQPVYDPDSQLWLPAMPMDSLKEKRYWIGFDPLSPPRPQELIRREPYVGSPVTLGDGQQWLIPHARELPHDLIRGEDGEWVRQVRSEFYAFAMTTIGWQRQFDSLEPGDVFPDETGLAEFVEEALRLNYRLTPEIISHLRLFSTGPTGTLYAAMIAAVHAPGED